MRVSSNGVIGRAVCGVIDRVGGWCRCRRCCWTVEQEHETGSLGVLAPSRVPEAVVADLVQAVNAGAKMHRFAGAKMHQGCWQKGPELGAFLSGIRLGSDCPRACPSWRAVIGACSD